MTNWSLVDECDCPTGLNCIKPDGLKYPRLCIHPKIPFQSFLIFLQNPFITYDNSTVHLLLGLLLIVQVGLTDAYDNNNNNN